MKAFVTGGSGFIGRHLVSQLLDRGYEVCGLAHSNRSAAELTRLGANVVSGDILDVASMREAMKGSDVVFHLAGWYHIGSRDWMSSEMVNVTGTRNVLRLANELGVPKIIYTSTITVYGDTKGQTVDETFYQGGPFITEYDRTKWLAHYKVAMPLIESGAPIIIVLPGAVYGPGDPSLIGELMRSFYEGRMPFVPGTKFTHSYAHVADVAYGHILAAEKGKVGESYILSGPAIPMEEIFDFWAQLTGKKAPAVRIPASLLQPLAPFLGLLNELVPLPELFSEEAIKVLAATYKTRDDKARTELGWRTRSLHEGMSETFQKMAEAKPAPPAIPKKTEREIAGLALLMAALIFLLWLISRKRK